MTKKKVHGSTSSSGFSCSEVCALVDTMGTRSISEDSDMAVVVALVGCEVETALGMFTPTASDSKMQVASIGAVRITVRFDIHYSVSRAGDD